MLVGGGQRGRTEERQKDGEAQRAAAERRKKVGARFVSILPLRIAAAVYLYNNNSVLSEYKCYYTVVPVYIDTQQDECPSTPRLCTKHTGRPVGTPFAHTQTMFQSPSRKNHIVNRRNVRKAMKHYVNIFMFFLLIISLHQTRPP